MKVAYDHQGMIYLINQDKEGLKVMEILNIKEALDLQKSLEVAIQKAISRKEKANERSRTN